ncbi:MULTISPECIES: hypothetical protein [unclassified Microcoleus]|uniref:hypothetical protein n=1 Tax=unclassified Microcoleus TaxID=2642155 RepID=UPI002FD4ECC6
MADLSLCLKRGLLAYNAPDCPCYIVLPKAKKRLFEKQLGRPIFQELQIFQLCKAINIEDIQQIPCKCGTLHSVHQQKK